ncbi:protein GRAVITROPIC IN THE LIGHT 1-like [Gossypium arboreum]|uniref:protein GRAVITROPIC IN THE LIGHT 1-like n=1 Tax=Gossypium arboreum TaxID=29729 RepID=UPI000818F27E|nr:protein GRAVITROPIC IN THE LIGHT 1-like [Gossypium arboreum]
MTLTPPWPTPPPHHDRRGSHDSHLDVAAKTIKPEAIFARESHKCFAFESFVCKTILKGFDSPDFGVAKDSNSKRLDPEQHFNTFKTLKSAHPKSFLAQNLSSSLVRFTKTKYLNLVYAKIECSFFRNLNQSKIVTSDGFLNTTFFTAFAEMFRQSWLLHFLGFSMHEQVPIFQVKKDCSLSEIYIENVTEESLLLDEINDGNVDSSLFVSGDYSSGQSMGDELVVEDRRVNFDFDEVDDYGGNLGDHDVEEGVGLGNR